MNTLRIVRLGSASYKETLRLQQELFKKRRAGVIPDTVLLCEHSPSVYTVGRRPDGMTDLLLSSTPGKDLLASRSLQAPPAVSSAAEEMRRAVDEQPLPAWTSAEGHTIELARINRGGRATWHGKGQLTVYPIINFKELRARSNFTNPRDSGLLRWWVRVLESTILKFLENQGIAAWTCSDVGVWVGGPVSTKLSVPNVARIVSEEERLETVYGPQRKMAALGVELKEYCSMHGVAINIDCDLNEYNGIVPCGISGAEVTSVRNELPNSTLTVDQSVQLFLDSFLDVLNPSVDIDVVEHPREHFLHL